MTTYFQFNPSPTEPYSFVPTLDGQQYNVTIVWSWFGQRWYLQLSSLQGQILLHKALIASPQDFGINMLFGYFKSTLVFRDATQQFEVSP